MSASFRQGLLNALSASMTAEASPMSAVASDHPDQELIDACIEFDRRESDKAKIPDDDDALDQLDDQQDPVFERICALQAKTMDGLRARAATARLWNAERGYTPDNEGGWIDDFTQAIWRDIGGRIHPYEHEVRQMWQEGAVARQASYEEALA